MLKALQKINTYFWYLNEYLKYRDFVSIYAAIRYLTHKKSHSKDRIIQTSVGKFFCRKNTNDFQFANYRYEWGVKKYILDHIQEYSVFIDAGSCIGDYTILVAKYGIRSIAIEPMPQNYEVLIKNLKLNNLIDKVKTFQIGLGNKNQMVQFKFNEINTGASHIDRDNRSTSCQIELRTLDSILDDLQLDTKDRILLKLDIEGMEDEALEGAARFITFHPNLTHIPS